MTNKYSKYQKQWRKDNPQKYKAQQQRKYQKNRDKYLEKRKLYRINHHDELLEKQREYRQNNLEKFVNYSKKHLAKYGLTFDMLYGQFTSVLNNWSKLVKQRDKNKCQICGKIAHHSHHIFPKAKYPQLALNINNGITLCKQHHYETHGWF